LCPALSHLRCAHRLLHRLRPSTPLLPIGQKAMRAALAALALFVSTAALAAPPAPTSLAIIACRVDDLTGQPGRQDPAMAAHNWRDLELHIVNGELECKREVIELQDQVEMLQQGKVLPLHPNFSEWSQCAAVAMSYAQTWNDANKGWAVVAAGCPAPIVDQNGNVLSYKLPECPSKLPGSDTPLKCRFDG